ncbi:glycosyltransferase family 39 protein [Paludibacterium yongneupense]|uniref:glycosyltransferase family 39 protein n=1 Tax=Paludibacterium yongneupense TaxID=400061 RepID=UPI000427D7E7|nr:glycosyltransferase family 39 protein [Paludibacterium yongneupense]
MMIVNSDERVATRVRVLIWLVFAVLWFASLGSRDLIHPDEGRYATIALDMLTHGDWLTPRLNGVLYFEKPILPYWMGALSLKWFGINEFAARLWPALTGFLSVTAVGFTAGRLWGARAGDAAALVMAGSVWVVANSHFLNLDMGVSFFLALALCAFLLAQNAADSSASRNWMWLVWAAMAGAVMSKGLIGLLIPGATLVLYSVLTRQLAFWGRLRLVSGLLLFFALVTPWFWLVSSRNPGFAWFFFVHEHFQRFLTTEHRRTGPVWYFVPYLLLGFMPWTSLLGRACRVGFGRDASQRFQNHRLLLIWAVFVFAFFSDSGSKLPSYILPMFPALALLAASALEGMSARALRWHLLLPFLFWTFALCAWLFGSHFLPARLLASEPFLALLRMVGWSSVPALLAVAFAWLCLGSDRKNAALAALSLSTLLAVTLVAVGHDRGYGRLKSSRELAGQLRPQLTDRTEVFSVRYYDQTFPFYLRRDVTLVDYADEFEFGETHEPARWIPTLDAFAARWRSSPSAMAMMKADTYADLSRQGVPMRVLYRDAERLVVGKP